jgi:hypothetical protein
MDWPSSLPLWSLPDSLVNHPMAIRSLEVKSGQPVQGVSETECQMPACPGSAPNG